ncbi:probable galacturonosyltransferase 15 [Magnolia sinica]|uniref:probable galacturonosyltransferase 15 n=1 Tax=Magnolia sinica TaxID=86752 RepID=UPI00265B2B6D|nr:probable galacturonosyltransferase 15 [Magnolia sinica]XP_058101003.1 probable galacturonosyltransferase 15 [Magnolia sinica]XP_058101004.1 probable galacturonosyltransferase 15 [Magnolia sinica]
MRVYILPGAKRVEISNGGSCFWEVMKVRGPSNRRFSYRSVLPTVLILGVLLPFLFIRAAFLALDGASKCSSTINCIGWRFGPGFFSGSDTSLRLAEELRRAVVEAKEEAGDAKGADASLGSFNDLVADVTSNQDDIRTFVSKTKSMLLMMDRKVRSARLQGSIYRHLASIGVPKSLHCLSLSLAEEYSVNALARSRLPSPDSISRLTDASYVHLAILTDNVLAASVVVSSAVRNSGHPERMVFHVITDKKTYTAMHAWFALNRAAPAVVEVKGLHQYDWPIQVNVGVMALVETHRAIREHYYYRKEDGKRLDGGDYRKLEALRPSCLSLMNYMRIYLPEIFPELNKIIFLDDDVVVQHDLSPLWAMDLDGKVNGAVSWWGGEGEQSYCLGRRFADYLNFSNSVISSEFDGDRCAWLYGMNVFDLQAWRRSNITQTYHHWLKLNLDSGFSLWRLGALPPALMAFNGNVHPIDPSWHVSGLGYQPPATDRKMLEAAHVIHFGGPAKPWLEIGFPELRSLWSVHVNFSNDFVRSCRVML